MSTETRIAVVGMACRLPGGSDSPEALWSMLAEGRDGWTEVPKDRWDWRSFYHEDAETKEALNFSHGYFLNKDLSGFDARFFAIPPSEANAVDPQQRLLLEVTYEALEDAGIPIESLRGSNTSVHMAMVSILSQIDSMDDEESHLFVSGVNLGMAGLKVLSMW